jgi:small subunit ribosomal protein S20
MANNKSALKRIRINKRNRLQNKFYKSSIRTLIRTFLKSLEEYKNSKNQSDKVKIQLLLNSLYSLLDKAVKKKIFHKNKAARKKSQLASKLKACY